MPTNRALTAPVVPVQRAAQILGISRGLAYEGVRRGEIPSLRIGGRILVPTAALAEMLGVEPSSIAATVRIGS